MSMEQALQWSENVETIEVADNLCHKLLRHINGSDTLFRQLIADEKPLIKYTGYRLLLNLLLILSFVLLKKVLITSHYLLTS